MGIKAENTKQIRELEAEFADEKIAEAFHMGEGAGTYISRRKGRLTLKGAIHYTIVAVIVVACIAVTLQFFTPRVILGSSMERTIASRDCVIIAKQAYAFKEVGYGDLVGHSPVTDGGGPEWERIGRVIGLPGDEIKIIEGIVSRNGERLDEAWFISDMADVAMEASVVPEGCFFVLESDRGGRLGAMSGGYGLVAKEQIRGKVVFRLLPVSRAGILS